MNYSVRLILTILGEQTLMKIDLNPPGLLSRRTFKIDGDRWVMREEWDISIPGCPMIRSPFHSQLGLVGNKFIRQVIMTAQEHAEYQAEKSGPL